MDWSIDGQTPEFLAATRMISLADPIVRSILADLELKRGMHVLDVGCGSGEYCFRLGSATEGVTFTGLEYDPRFVDFANARARGEVGYPYQVPNPANDYHFICGDGLDLPFPDGAFDAVISHTYLTALPDWAAALAEMCRVCKPGGTVSSVTSLTDDFYGTGAIELFSGLLAPDDAAVIDRMNNAKARTFENMPLASGIAPRKAPVAFAWMGLEDVRCTPLAHYFCLSDARTDARDYARYVDLLCAMEHAQLERIEAARALSESDLARYAELVENRRDQLMASIGANREWTWYGNASLLVSGTMPQGGLGTRCAEFRKANANARALLDDCGEVGLAVNHRTEQLGYGRCVKTVFSTGNHDTLTVFGFDPPSALVEGCSKLLARQLANTQGEADEMSDGAACNLAKQECACEQAEQLASSCTDSARLVPDELVYAHDRMWETVSEAALAGYATRFAYADNDSATYHATVIACTISSSETSTTAIAAHPDPQVALERSFARALGMQQENRALQPHDPLKPLPA